MATKIYCAAIDCEYYREDGRCTAKTVCLSGHSIMTVWEGRQRFQRCKTYQKSKEMAEIEKRFLPLMEKMANAGTKTD